MKYGKKSSVKLIEYFKTRGYKRSKNYTNY